MAEHVLSFEQALAEVLHHAHTLPSPAAAVAAPSFDPASSEPVPTAGEGFDAQAVARAEAAMERRKLVRIRVI